MRTWNLQLSKKLPLFLVSDMRLGKTDYCNDHIWELGIGSAEPPALTLATTFGLRARTMRFFPIFYEADKEVVDPATYPKPVVIRQFFPNYIKLIFTPLSNIDVEIEYWVPNSHVVTTRTKVTNTGTNQRQIQLSWGTILNPLPGGERMKFADIGLNHILTGKSENVSPTLVMSDGALHSKGPFTSLTVPLTLLPKSSKSIQSVLASLEDMHSSFNLARKMMETNWDAETARIYQVNANQVEIYTGDSTWDLAFCLAQYRVNELLFQGSDHLPHASYVETRLPDQGFSHRGDGSDYGHQWCGQSPLETLFLTEFLLPAQISIAQGLLENFLSTITNDGFMDWKPGLAGQRSQLLASPLLVSLAWNIYQASDDLSFLEKVFPDLLSFILHWFSATFDQDGDGIPEWNHSLQTDLDEHPIFSTWDIWSHGVAIKTVESPDLCTLLYQACNILIEIAHLVGRQETTPALQAFSDHLHTAVEAGWNEADSCYYYWDRDSHHSIPKEQLGTRQGPGEILVQKQFEKPVRILVHVQSSDESTRPLHIYIHGNAPSGGHRVEKFNNEEFRWRSGHCRVTSERIYALVEQVRVTGLHETDQISVYTVGHQERDITTLLPLWAGIPGEERANKLISQTIKNPKVFWGRYGIRTYAEKRTGETGRKRRNKMISIPYNSLIGYGLVRYGQLSKAAELVTHIMKAILLALKQEGTFRRFYQSENGKGGGERFSLPGLPPLGLFLEVLGVRIINPHKVILSGKNPYPWPVTIKYNGLTVVRHKYKTMVLFPNGQNTTIKNDKTRTVELE